MGRNIFYFFMNVSNEIFYNVYIGLWVVLFYWCWVIVHELPYFFYSAVLEKRKCKLQKQTIHLLKKEDAHKRDNIMKDIIDIEHKIELLSLQKQESLQQYLKHLQKRFMYTR